MEIGPQLVIEGQLQSIFRSRPMEDEELQQPIVEQQLQLVHASRHAKEKKL